jgi:hypothetical protein
MRLRWVGWGALTFLCITTRGECGCAERAPEGCAEYQRAALLKRVVGFQSGVSSAIGTASVCEKGRF